MKTQVAWNFRRRRTELQVSSQRGETLDIPGADWLQTRPSELLLPMDYNPDLARSKKLELCYDITGLTMLRRRVGKVWSQDGYYAMLEGIERVCAECAAGTRLIERILFDPEHVYLTERDEPRFVYVPMDGVAYDASVNSPLLVLDLLSGKRLRFDSAACTANAERLRQWVRSRQVFSPNDFRGFLDREYAALRSASHAELSAWDLRGAGPSSQQLAYMDELFAAFDRGPTEADGSAVRDG